MKNKKEYVKRLPMKTLFTALILILGNVFAWANEGVFGFWTTIDDETKEAKSVVQIYEYKGKVYGCEIWRDGENLIVRGKIAFFGRNQTWIPNKTFKGDGKPLTPKKPKL